jgi:succinate-acetate transporter protein
MINKMLNAVAACILLLSIFTIMYVFSMLAVDCIKTGGGLFLLGGLIGIICICWAIDRLFF